MSVLKSCKKKKLKKILEVGLIIPPLISIVDVLEIS